MSSKPVLKIDWATHEAAKYACENWHYSETIPAGSHNKIGVWEDGIFVGVILFGRPAFPSIGKAYGLTQFQMIELVRVALNNHVTPVSKMISIGIKMIKKHNPKLEMLVSFADQNQGHHGGIYQAGNWVYVGDGGATVQYKLKGKNIHQRNLVHLFGQGFKKHPDVTSYIPKPKHKYLMPLNEKMRIKIQSIKKPYPKRASSVESGTSVYQTERGGESPTDALQSNEATHG